ncbi:MAG: hypothetical protein ACRD0P_02320 [Stackebrandtia sp.]
MAPEKFFPKVLPGWVRSLAAGIPEAPEGEKPLPGDRQSGCCPA